MENNGFDAWDCKSSKFCSASKEREKIFSGHLIVEDDDIMSCRNVENQLASTPWCGIMSQNNYFQSGFRETQVYREKSWNK